MAVLVQLKGISKGYIRYTYRSLSWIKHLLFSVVFYVDIQCLLDIIQVLAGVIVLGNRYNRNYLTRIIVLVEAMKLLRKILAANRG